MLASNSLEGHSANDNARRCPTPITTTYRLDRRLQSHAVVHFDAQSDEGHGTRYDDRGDKLIARGVQGQARRGRFSLTALTERHGPSTL